MEIRHKKVSELTPVEFRACYAANYGYEGYMREELNRCKRGHPGQVILLWDGPDNTARSLIGWALLTPTRCHGLLAVTRHAKSRSTYTAQFWVKSRHRRKGYGKILMQEVKNYDPRPHVIPHDEASGELFSSFNVQVLQREDHWIKRGKPKVA